MKYAMQIKLNCAHAIHILWPCKSSVVVWLPADSHTKNTHGTAKVFRAVFLHDALWQII